MSYQKFKQFEITRIPYKDAELMANKVLRRVGKVSPSFVYYDDYKQELLIHFYMRIQDNPKILDYNELFTIMANKLKDLFRNKRYNKTVRHIDKDKFAESIRLAAEECRYEDFETVSMVG